MILSFLTSISDLVSSVIGMVINLFSMLFIMLTAVPKALSYVVGAVGYMPAYCGSIILLSITIAVTISIINHWGN